MIHQKNKPRGVKEVLIVHPDMNIGGAETQLINLVRGLANSADINLTVALYNATGPLMPELSAVQSINVVDLKRKTVGRFKALVRLARLVRQRKPDVVYTLLIGPNIVSGLLSYACSIPMLVWGNRVSWFEDGEFGVKGRFSILIAKCLVKKVDLLISNSTAGEKEWHTAIGAPKQSAVIPNGLDTDKYRFDISIRKRVRAELNVNTKFLIGKIARVVPWKGYEVFLQAVALVIKEQRNLSFVCVGSGDKTLLFKYMTLSETLGLASHVHWLGGRDDIADLICAMDIVTLASTSGEGFSNVVGEAMSSGRVVVATNVGESAAVIKDAGLIV